MVKRVVLLLALLTGSLAVLAGCGAEKKEAVLVETETPAPVETEIIEEKPTEARNKENPPETEIKESEAETEVVPVEVVLSNTYQSRFGEVNGVGAHRFCWDYPDNWTVTTETVGNGTEPVMEMVELQNDRGSTITYMDFTQFGDGYGNTYYNIMSEIVEPSGFQPMTDMDDDGEPDADYGNIVIAKGKIIGEMESDVDEDMIPTDSGGEFYAIMSDKNIGLQEWINGEGGLFETYSFVYPIEHFSLIAQPADGTFTDTEREEVLRVLESFREE